MNALRRSILASVACFLLTTLTVGCSEAAAPAKKQYTFHGKVESVNQSAGSMSVNGEKVEGWMGAMTMEYKVDNPSILTKVKPGDRIAATVYDGDYTLHDVRLDAGTPESKK